MSTASAQEANTSADGGLVTVVLPVMNEVRSLSETIAVINSSCVNRNLVFLVVLSPRTTDEAVRNVLREKAKDPERVSVITQTRPGLGGAMIDAFEAARGAYVLMMSSDLETDPRTVAQMLRTSVDHPDAVIATTRWKGAGAGFESYGTGKRLANLVFQRLVGAIYGTGLTDLTYGFRLYPRDAIAGQKWVTTNHAFLLESLLRPLREGWPIVEIPAYWTPRREGISNNAPNFYLGYFKVALLVRFGR